MDFEHFTELLDIQDQRVCKENFFVSILCYCVFKYGHGKNEINSKNLMTKSNTGLWPEAFIPVATQNFCWQS